MHAAQAPALVYLVTSQRAAVEPEQPYGVLVQSVQAAAPPKAKVPAAQVVSVALSVHSLPAVQGVHV